MLVSGFIWLAGMKFLPADTAAVEDAADDGRPNR